MRATGWWKDVRYAGRNLARSPGFAGISLLTLALGIGANTAVFTLVDGVVLRPLPYREPEQLVSLEHLGRGGQDELRVSTGLYLLYRQQAHTLLDLALFFPTTVNLVAAEGEPERVDGQVVTPGLFEVLGVTPARGRAFEEAHGRPGGDPVVMLSDGLWRSRFGADPDVVGKTVLIDGVSRRILGVLPRDFGFPDAASSRFYLPMVIDSATAPLAAFGPGGIARLAPGATVDFAKSELQGLISRLETFFPGSGQAAFLGQVGLQVTVTPLKEAVVGNVSRTLWILLGTVGLVLLIACANVANLFLVRAEGRQREMAVRRALGGGRWAVLRPYIAESMILGGVGCAAGLAIAAMALGGARALAPANLPRADEVGMDLRVLGFTAGISLFAAILFGVVPLLSWRGTALSGQLKDGRTRGTTSARDRLRVRNVLVVTQVSLALVLLVGAGLMLRSFFALRTVDPGFDARGVLTVRLSVPPGEIADPLQAGAFYRQLLDRLAAQPGVTAAGAANGLPLGGTGQMFTSIEVEDHPRSPDELPIFANGLRVAAGWFDALGIQIIEGRPLVVGDAANGLRAVVVSRSFAQRWWPNGGALGRRVRQGTFEDWYEIVGVAEDVHHTGLEEAAEEMIYYPSVFGPTAQPATARAMDVAVRTAGDPLSFLPVLRREVMALNPNIPVANPRTMESILSNSMSATSFTMVVLGAASAVALVLGMVGIYGVISYVVTRRTREIGVRMALGASSGTVRSMVVRQGMLLAGAGLVLGLGAALALSTVMQSLLYGVGTRDPLTYASVALLLAAVSVLASWIPAHRAASVHPAVALRTE